MGDVKDLKPVLDKVMDYVRKRAVVSAEELAMVIEMWSGSTQPGTGGGTSREPLGENPEEAIIGVLTAQGNGESGPRLASREYKEETFYHAAGDVQEHDLEAALLRLAELRSMDRLEEVEDIVGAFLSKSGYEVMSRPWPQDPVRCRQMMARKPDRQLDVFVFSSIESAPACAQAVKDSRREWVIAVPTESSPGPFLRFCKEKVADFADGKLQVWVVDRDKKSVNPFLGYTHDDEVYRNFDDPKTASFACRWYGVGKELWVRPSL